MIAVVSSAVSATVTRLALDPHFFSNDPDFFPKFLELAPQISHIFLRISFAICEICRFLEMGDLYWLGFLTDFAKFRVIYFCNWLIFISSQISLKFLAIFRFRPLDFAQFLDCFDPRRFLKKNSRNVDLGLHTP